MTTCTAAPDVGAPPAARLLRRPVLAYWLVAVALEVVLAATLLLTGADAAVGRAFEAAGLEFNTDLLTWGRVLLAYPAAALGAVLALGQVAAPDIAVLAVSARRGGRRILTDVSSRLVFWSREVGWRRGLRVWAGAVVTLTACNLASGGLHLATVPSHLTWTLTAGVLPMLLVAMFLDAGALFEENGWRGYALPLLVHRYGYLAGSLVLGLAWSAWHYPVKFDVFVEYGLAGGAAYLAAMTLKLTALTVVMTFFWSWAGRATILAIAMHGLANDAARVGGASDYATWEVSVVTELNLAAPLVVAAVIVVLVARRKGWAPRRAGA